jgi:hypothetical protein
MTGRKERYVIVIPILKEIKMAMIPKATAQAEKPVLKGNVKHAEETTPGPAASTPGPAAVAAAPVETTAVAIPPAGAVSTNVRKPVVDFLKGNFKDAFKVDWNTLRRIQANQGNFLDLEENKKMLGGVMVFEMMSYQDNWQISPGTDDKSDAEFVRYSNDGVMTQQGENCNQYLAELIESGRTKAKMTQRVTLAGTAILPGSAIDGQLIQIDLSQSSRQLFERFRMQTALDVSRGARTEDQCVPFKMSCKVVSKGDNSWTVVNFDYAS